MHPLRHLHNHTNTTTNHLGHSGHPGGHQARRRNSKGHTIAYLKAANLMIVKRSYTVFGTTINGTKIPTGVTEHAWAYPIAACGNWATTVWATDPDHAVALATT